MPAKLVKKKVDFRYKYLERIARESIGIENRRQNMIRQNKDPEFTRKHVEASHTPEIRKIRQKCSRKAMFELRKNPEVSLRRREAAKEAHQTLEFREIARQQMLKNRENPEFNRKRGEAYHCPYDGPNGHIPMKSNWEVKFAELLDHCGFSWKYEPKKYKMEFEEIKLPSYTPDFWVNEFNCYFETKGWNTEIAFVRAEICGLLHKVKVVVLDGPLLEKLGLWNDTFPKKDILVERLNSFRVA